MILMNKHVLIVESILRDVDEGRLRQGDKIPSYAELREQYQCSLGTVRSAMLVLKAMKWVRGEQGVGMYIQEQEDL